MTETGIIFQIKENLVLIIPEKSSACFGCLNTECKKEDFLITAENPHNLALKAGLKVELKIPANLMLLNQALIALLPPIFGFIIGYLTVRIFFPLSGEGIAIFTGLFLLFSAAYTVYRIRKMKPAESGYKVMRIINQDKPAN